MVRTSSSFLSRSKEIYVASYCLGAPVVAGSGTCFNGMQLEGWSNSPRPAADGEATEAELEAANGSVEFSDMEAQSQGEAGADRQLSARVVDALKTTRWLVDPSEPGYAYSIARKTSHSLTADFVPNPGSGFGLNVTLPRDESEWAVKVKLLRDIFGNPFRPVAFKDEWRTSTVVALSDQMYRSRDFSAMPILADALEDAGCDNPDVLDHCHGDGPHVRGCWVVDLVRDKW